MALISERIGNQVQRRILTASWPFMFKYPQLGFQVFESNGHVLPPLGPPEHLTPRWVLIHLLSDTEHNVWGKYCFTF